MLFCVTSDVDCAISSPDASPSKCLPNFISLQQISEQEDLLFSSYLAHNCSQKDVYWYNSTDLVPFWHSLLLVHVFILYIFYPCRWIWILYAFDDNIHQSYMQRPVLFDLSYNIPFSYMFMHLYFHFICFKNIVFPLFYIFKICYL